MSAYVGGKREAFIGFTEAATKHITKALVRSNLLGLALMATKLVSISTLGEYTRMNKVREKCFRG